MSTLKIKNRTKPKTMIALLIPCVNIFYFIQSQLDKPLAISFLEELVNRRDFC